MKVEAVADEEMIKNAVSSNGGGDDEYAALAEPGNITANTEHKLWVPVRDAIKEIYDPEIPVNIYELGLIYNVEFEDREDGKSDVSVQMTLTSPGCPVAQEMPGWVQGAIFPIEGVENVDVEIIWDPPWDASIMSESAKMQLNMFM